MNSNQELNSLVCPDDGGELETRSSVLSCRRCGGLFPIDAGIARFIDGIDDERQAQVKQAFGFKWSRDSWGFKDAHRELMLGFFKGRFQFDSESEIERFFAGKTVLSVGIGNGQSEQIFLKYCKSVWGCDISESVDACRRNWQENYPDLVSRLQLAQADVMRMPFAEGSFDIVFSDGVLHHTPNTFEALKAATAKLKSSGKIVFYIYRIKAPIREFVDDYIRERISHMPPQQAFDALKPLTALAHELSSASLDISVPQNIDLLGIKSGSYDLQRWIYWNVMKFYWNDALSEDENNHINFDWYYPKYAHRHTTDEVEKWLAMLHLNAEIINVTESGISVIADKEQELA